MPTPQVLLSTSSVYPEASTSAFELSASLGFDGIELMIGVDSLSIDIDAVAKLADYHGVRVQSVHAPTLLVTQGTWGSDPWDKLRRSGEAALRLGGDAVVVHPPFRWQREYGAGFVEGIRRLNAEMDVKFCVENMFPWRTPAGSFQAYLPGWDPTPFDYEHLTLDLSHASTSKQKSLDLVDAWGERLTHVHLTDGDGSIADSHLFPGEGDQDAHKVLATLAARGFAGHVVLELNTRSIGSRSAREEALARALAWSREALTVPVVR